MAPPYQNTTDFFIQAIKACWINAQSLSSEADAALKRGSHPLGLSLAVLALEEIGKLIAADGLLFAKPGDDRSRRFEKALRSHTLKLEVLDVFPLLVHALSLLDPRYQAKPKFRESLAITLTLDRELRSELAEWLGDDCALAKLDHWKQKGLYANLGPDGRLRTPQDTVPVALAEKVAMLAKRYVGTLNFLLRDNLERYRERAGSMRARVTEDELQTLRATIAAIFEADSSLNGATADIQH